MTILSIRFKTANETRDDTICVVRCIQSMYLVEAADEYVSYCVVDGHHGVELTVNASRASELVDELTQEGFLD